MVASAHADQPPLELVRVSRLEEVNCNENFRTSAFPQFEYVTAKFLG